MADSKPSRVRLYLTALVMLAEVAHLAWEYFNGGVRSHHILNRSDLPEISNWLGLLLLPALSWHLIGRIQKRIALHSGGTGTASKFPTGVVTGFIGSLLFGILLSVSFTNDHETVASLLFRGMFLLALLLPAYRAEYLLGFVLGMTFTFGAVLPTAIGTLFVVLSAGAHLLVRPALMRIWTRLKGSRSPAF
ncbi:MAG: hypothetical protein M3Q13_05680 [Pseudomonadota bacterium]|nr:hypothetical protein [Pseudomonadota bacterium]